MNVLVNVEKMCVLHKNPSVTTLTQLAWLEAPDVHTTVFDCTHADEYDQFTDFELKLLYTSMTGEKYNGFFRDVLLQNVMNVIQLLPVWKGSILLLKTQADAVPLEDEETLYSFCPTATVPTKQKFDWVAPALVAAQPYTPVLVATPAAKTQPAPATQGLGVLIASSPAPRAVPKVVTNWNKK